MGLLTKLQKSYQTEVSFLDDSYSKLNNLTPVSIMEQIEPTKVSDCSYNTNNLLLKLNNKTIDDYLTLTFSFRYRSLSAYLRIYVLPVSFFLEFLGIEMTSFVIHNIILEYIYSSLIRNHRFICIFTFILIAQNEILQPDCTL